MDIAVEATAECPEGAAGRVTHLVVDRAFMRVTYVVVREACRLPSERLVPFRFVQHSSGDVVSFQCSRAELSTMRPATSARLVETEVFVCRDPSSHGRPIHSRPRLREVKHQNLSETECPLTANTRVRATDGNAGRLVGLTVEPESGEITHLVFQHRTSWATRTLALPIDVAAEVGSGAVYIRRTRADIAALAPAPASTLRSSRR